MIVPVFFPAPLGCGMAIVSGVRVRRDWGGVGIYSFLLAVGSMCHYQVCQDLRFTMVLLRLTAEGVQSLLVNCRGGCPGCRPKCNWT